MCQGYRSIAPTMKEPTQTKQVTRLNLPVVLGYGLSKVPKPIAYRRKPAWLSGKMERNGLEIRLAWPWHDCTILQHIATEGAIVYLANRMP